MTPEEVDQLIDCYSGALELYAAQFCHCPTDVVQDAFMQLFQQDQPPKRIASWLYRVVRNRSLSVARSTERRRKHEAAAGASRPWFDEFRESEVDAQVAEQALRSLPTQQREVIIARIWGGLSFAEVAEAVGISTSAAHRRYEAGLAALRERLGVAWRAKNMPLKG